jgi:ATP-dependent exoDNAse (exonuclease V) alpha subunit
MKYEEAKELLLSTKDNLLITGGAGTGKTTLLLEYLNSGVKNVAVLAPTGVAALNVRGQTIHSFFGFPPNVTPSSYKLSYTAKILCPKLEVMVIDEVSMVRADLLDCIDLGLQEARKNDKPFGGLRMIFVGDLCQLSPVVSGFGDEKLIFGGIAYNSPFFFDAMVFAGFTYKKVNLTQVFRQKDEWFINFLNNVRIGEVDYVSLAKINKACVTKDSIPESTIFLAATNSIVDEINASKLRELNTEEFKHSAKIEGCISSGQMPTDEWLKVKIGCQLMLINNDKQGRWVNGTIGILEDTGFDLVEISTGEYEEGNPITKIEEQLCLFVRIDQEKIIRVTPYTWEVTELELNKGMITRKIVGKFTQFPVKVAWAFTIHKSQGKTYNNVAIKFDNRPMYSPGQLYVALSRCTSMQGLKLSRAIRPSDIVTNKKVKEFYANA